MDEALDYEEGYLESNAALARHSGGRGGRRGGGGGGGKKSRGGPGAGRSREVALSKALSRLLRHQAESAGIKLDREGFAPLDRVLQWGPIRSLAPSLAEIQAAVRDSDKQRFAMRPNPATNPLLDESATDPAAWLIRANQGHSIRVESDALLRPIVLPTTTTTPKDAKTEAGAAEVAAAAAAESRAVPVPPTVVHGTYYAFWPRIVESGGLKPMGRTHVHCSTGVPEEVRRRHQGDEAPAAAAAAGETAAAAAATVLSGMRRDAELLVYVDVERSMREAGMRWWMSENGVVLTEGDENGLVPLRFFREVVGRRSDGVGVLWKDGVKVADLPDHIEARIPRGKGRAGEGGGGGGGGGGSTRGKGKGRGKA